MKIIFFIIALIMLSGHAESADVTNDHNDKKIEEFVMRDMLSLLPDAVSHVCMVELVSDGNNRNILKIIDVGDIDNRVIKDNNICTGPLKNDESHANIVYMGDVTSMIKDIDIDKNTDNGKIFAHAKHHIREGNFLILSAFNKCGGDQYMYAFSGSDCEPRLIERFLAGPIECETLQK